VFEHSDVVKSYLVRWKNAKTNLTALARKRWIEKASIENLCNEFGRRRTAIRDSIRTIRSVGLDELELSDGERGLILKAMAAEDKVWGHLRK
jgi:hypothetical protein